MCIDILFISIEEVVDYFTWRFKICRHTIVVICLKKRFYKETKKNIIFDKINFNKTHALS